jgi:hypothetical protein
MEVEVFANTPIEAQLIFEEDFPDEVVIEVAEDPYYNSDLPI